MNDINDIAKTTINKFKEANPLGMKRAVKKEVGQFIFNETKRKPIILPIIIEV